MKENDKKIVELRDSAYNIISEEKLPRPTNIKFRSSMRGTRLTGGCCIKNKYKNEYRIIIHLVVAKYFKITEEEAKEIKNYYINKKDNTYYKRAMKGNEKSFDNIKTTLAHEIAHLKFWDHTPEHLSYTQHILKKINQRIGG